MNHIKLFESFNQDENFEEIKDYFIDFIDDYGVFEKWDYYSDSLLEYPELTNFRKKFDDLVFVKIETSHGKALNHNFAILTQVPKNVDISHIDFNGFFEGHAGKLEQIEKSLGYKVIYVSRHKQDNYYDDIPKYIMGIVFGRKKGG